MRAMLTAIAGAAFVTLAATPSFADHKANHTVPTPAEVEAARAERDPCHAISNGPRELVGLQALQARCRELIAKRDARPNDAALRAECDEAARALTGHPC